MTEHIIPLWHSVALLCTHFLHTAAVLFELYSSLACNIYLNNLYLVVLAFVLI